VGVGRAALTAAGFYSLGVATNAETTWDITDADGELTVHTGVGGRAARMGHRLTLLMASWRITVTWSAGTPVAAQLVVDVDSLQVLHGEGGVTPLSGAEKTVARGNALKALQAKRFPQIEFHPETITGSDNGYRLAGPLRIHGVSRPCEAAVVVVEGGDHWHLTCRAEVRQTDFGVKRFSMMMGAMKVDDVVTVSLDARRTAPAGLL
jgi:polyisoprenoid-binding protein YceI